MATFNGAEFLREQICSILSQLGPNDELVISDDGSIDDTLAIIGAFNDGRIKVFINEGSRGYSTNFNNAIEKATGDVIFLSDQDDIWLPSKVEKCLKELKKSDFVVHDAKVVDYNLQILMDSYFDYRNVKPGFVANFVRIGYLGCCMAFKRKVLDKANPMPLKYKVITHDSWLTLVSEFYFSVSLIDEPLLLYRRHGSNVSNGGASEGNSLAFKVYIRVFSLLKIVSRFRIC
ncbi:glycosyltransferase family 2 protein [Shewanella marisflavi]|uniref:Alpha-L-Rha alpha-1,3-L-rhamnosyltransferase n=1 Tax=Shewanella marisflavi TaxID=260364 RepID=A0AAC9U2K0_9GAMM|nr:glycosyltransferase family 2 protein [Shewanella marisflavi]ASJ97321.1 alpha-L-Rha alpha-1,3-L-rhamnosyltransferase [Shewanella marisflavi]